MLLVLVYVKTLDLLGFVTDRRGFRCASRSDPPQGTGPPADALESRAPDLAVRGRRMEGARQ